MIIKRQKVVNLERWLAKELRNALAFQRQQLALDRAHAGLSDIAIFGREVFGIFSRMSEHALQITQIKQQQALIVGKTENDVQNAGLRLVQIKQASEQKWAHFRDGGANGMAFFAIEIPEDSRIVAIAIIIHAQLFGAPFKLVSMFELSAARHRNARQIALHIGDEHWHAAL